MLERRSAIVWGYQALAAIGGWGIMFAAVLLIPHKGSRALLFAIATTLAMIWTVVFATRAFRKSDEYLRERSTVSWYWGSLMGLTVSAPIFIFILLGGLHGLSPMTPADKGLANAFVLGYGLPLIAQVMGFFAMWVWQRLSAARSDAA